MNISLCGIPISILDPDVIKVRLKDRGGIFNLRLGCGWFFGAKLRGEQRDCGSKDCTHGKKRIQEAFAF